MPRNASFAVLPPSSDLAPLVDGLRTDSKLAAQLLYTAYLPGSEDGVGASLIHRCPSLSSAL